jgi:hypothetical protein
LNHLLKLLNFGSVLSDLLKIDLVLHRGDLLSHGHIPAHIHRWRTSSYGTQGTINAQLMVACLSTSGCHMEICQLKCILVVPSTVDTSFLVVSHVYGASPRHTQLFMFAKVGGMPHAKDILTTHVVGLR